MGLQTGPQCELKNIREPFLAVLKNKHGFEQQEVKQVFNCGHEKQNRR